MISKLTPLAAAAALFLLAMPLHAQEQDSAAEKPQQKQSSGRFPKDVEGLQEMARQAIEDGSGLRLLQTTILLRRQQPYEPEHQVNMVRAYAMMERPTSAYHYMLQMQQQGLSYDFDQLEETADIRDTEVYTYLNDLLIRAGDPAGEAELAFELEPADHAYPSAIAWDETRERFLIGTAGDGALLAVDENGHSKALLEAGGVDGLWAIMDIGVDAEHDRLWLTTAAIHQFEDYSDELAGKGALLEFELGSLELVGRYPVERQEGPVVPGSIALHPGGDVFVADRETAVVYRKRVDSDRVVPFVADNSLDGFNDIAISTDGARLYLADTAKGILVVDPESEQAALLEGPDTLNLGGIESLFQVGSELFIIQSGIDPQRIMALVLDASGGTVTEVRPMAIALEPFNGPSFGTVRGEAIYYFANGQLPEPGAPANKATVLKTALDAGDTIVAPDMRKFEEETLSRARDHQ